VVLVVKGGIGRSIDEVALNKALFDKEGVELLGVVLKQNPARQVRSRARIRPARPGAAADRSARGDPDEPLLANATLGQICQDDQRRLPQWQNEGPSTGAKGSHRAMNSTHVMEYFKPGTLVITPGDREDVILAALSTSTLSELNGQSIAGWCSPAT
jgi:BioD-like phosphotransacetylase family protein